MKIIITGHGNFASGLLTSLKLIAGEQAHTVGVDFIESDTTEILSEKLKAEILDGDKEILILSDLLGGSPFKESVMLKTTMGDKNIEVLAGTNFPMVLMSTLSSLETADELASSIVLEGQNSISRYRRGNIQVGKSDDEEGI